MNESEIEKTENNIVANNDIEAVEASIPDTAIEANTETEEQKASENNASSSMFQLPTAVNTLIARSEAVQIVITTVNALLSVLQRKGIELAPEEIEILQHAIDSETKKTDKMYLDISKALAAIADTSETTKSES